MFRSRKRTEYITIAPSVRVWVKDRVRVRVWGGGGAIFLGGNCPIASLWQVSGKFPRRKIAPRLGLEFGLGIELELMLVGGNFPRELSQSHSGNSLKTFRALIITPVVDVFSLVTFVAAFVVMFNLAMIIFARVSYQAFNRSTYLFLYTAK